MTAREQAAIAALQDLAEGLKITLMPTVSPTVLSEADAVTISDTGPATVN